MKTPIEQYVIDKVREKRLAQKMSQATLAYCLGVSRGFIGDVENPNQRAKYNLNHINELSIIFPTFSLLPLSLLQKNFKH